jgi:hypothetical protein
MWKLRLISLFIIILPIVCWELALRPNGAIPFHPERDSRSVKDVILSSRYLLVGNSMVGALPRDFKITDPNSGVDEQAFNLEYVFHRYSHGIVFRPLEILNRLNVQNKTILINIDSHQLANTLKTDFYTDDWIRIRDRVLNDKYKVYDRDPTMELYGFREFTRITITDIVKGTKKAMFADLKYPVSFMRYLSFIRWSLPVTAMKLKLVTPQSLASSVFDGFREDDFQNYYPLLGELVKAKAISKELMKETLSPLLHGPLMNGYKNPIKNRDMLTENFNLLKQELTRLEQNGNRVVLMRLVRDPELIEYENKTFPQVQEFCETWTSGCVDVTELKMFLFDGIHPHDEDAELELHEIKKQLSEILKRPKS